MFCTFHFFRRSKSSLPAPKITGWLLPGIILFFAVGYNLAAYSCYRHQHQEALAAAKRQLEIVAGLKVADLNTWSQERQNDSDLIYDSHYASLVQTYFADPVGAKIRPFRLLEKLQRGGYERIIVLDPRLNLKYALPASSPLPEGKALQLAAEALHAGKICSSGLHRVPELAGTYLDFAVPLLIDAPPRPTTPTLPPKVAQSLRQPVAILLFRVNANTFLFPKIQSWPAASQSAEILVLGPEGDNIVCLSSLRSQTGCFAKIENSTRRPGSIESLSTHGPESSYCGRDYRGVPVVAAARYVPSLHCFLIAKIDQSEVYAGLWGSTEVVITVQLILVLLTLIASSLLWLDRDRRYSQFQLESQREATEALRQNAERFRAFTSATFEGIVISENGIITDVNEQHLRLLGFARPEFLGKQLIDLVPLSDAPSVQQRISLRSEQTYETRTLTKDGRLLEVEIRPRMLAKDGRTIRISAIRDITERKRQESDLRRLNQLYRLLSRVNHATVHMSTRQDLFDEICRAAVDSGGFGMTWIGWLNQNLDRVQPVAASEINPEFFAHCEIPLHDGPRSQGGVGTAMATGRPFIANDFLAEPRLQPWHALARARGFQSLAVFPLRLESSVQGVLAVHAYQKNYFRPAELELLEEVSMDVSAALDHFEAEFKRKHTEHALRQSEYWLRQSQRIARVGSYIIDLPTGAWTSSETFDEIAGLDGKFEKLAGSWQKIVHPQDWPAVRALAFKIIARKKGAYNTSLVYRIIRQSDHEERWVYGRARLFCDADGKPAQLQGVLQDITERKQAEDLQRRMEEQLRLSQKMEAIGNLAAGISHEINTPVQFAEHNLKFLQFACPFLVQIEQQTSLLVSALASPSPLQPEVLRLQSLLARVPPEMICQEIPAAIQESLEGMERIRKIVLAMKEFSHPGAGRSGQPELTNLRTALENTILVAKNEWKYVADLHTEFDPAVPLVPAFPSELNQVILNLIINATHAIAEAMQNDPGRKGLISIRTRLDGPWAEIRVQDNGTGIPPENRHRIFELFFTTKPVGKGTGQGLALSHSIIVERHGGTLAFESEAGRGTSFIIRLPVHPPLAVARKPAAPQTNPPL